MVDGLVYYSHSFISKKSIGISNNDFPIGERTIVKYSWSQWFPHKLAVDGIIGMNCNGNTRGYIQIKYVKVWVQHYDCGDQKLLTLPK